MTQILENIFISSVSFYLDEKFLMDNRISFALSVCDFVPSSTFASSLRLALEYLPESHSIQGVDNVCFQIEDDDESDIISYFDCACNIIDDKSRQGAVLVHCISGISRSATIMAAYIMKKYGIGVYEALIRLREKHPVSCPNDGFMKQLKLYERMNFRLNFEDKHLAIFYLRQLNLKMRNGCDFTSYVDKLSKFVPEERTSRIKYKCKKCRVELFDDSRLIRHSSASEPPVTLTVGTMSCRQSIYVIPTSWMLTSDILHSKEGKIACFKCRTKLGRYSWPGIKCRCSSIVEAAFEMQHCKIDTCPKITDGYAPSCDT
ncbi:Uncharacterised protein g2562 [Pycnogonum litorale]